ncbi:MAG: hypothetical protein JXQ77_02930 [Campylobacterales bacterium]|nr:hypothetical protein [Campylobacterales bacterium]
MYCIINQTKDIIAADEEFFSLLKSANLIELYKQIASGAIDIAFEEDKVTIANLGDIRFYKIENFEISGLLSQSKIVKILPEIPKDETKTDTDTMMETFSEQKEELSQYNEPIKAEEDLSHDTNTVNSVFQDIVFDESKNNKDEPRDTAQDETTYIKIEPQESTAANIEIQPLEKTTAYDTAIIKPESPTIDLDTHEISQKMGLSKTDYITFLKEYIQTVKSLRKDLESKNKDIQKSAVGFIVHLSDVLHLPENISNLVTALSSSATQENIDDFYNAIEQILTDSEEVAQYTNDANIKEEAADIVTLDTNDADLKQKVVEPVELEKDDLASEIKNENLEQESISSMDLSNITPIKFDFALDETANALSLPNDIVKDFIKDFIEQCHAEAANFIDAYEKGDIERIKKTARLLKGVASNLYITPLAQSLLELQYNDDIKQAEALIKKFWAQFVAFEELMKNE